MRKRKAPLGSNASGAFLFEKWLRYYLLGHVLKLFQGECLNLNAGRLGGNVHGLTGTEGIRHAALRLTGGLLDGLDLQEAGQCEMADGPLFDVAIDNISDFVQNGSYVFFGDFGVLGDLSEKLSLGHGLFEGRGLSHIVYLPRYIGYMNAGKCSGNY